MANYIMTAKELILTSGSSRGSQIKFYKDNYWYKLDESGPEGKAEELASRFLSCSNLSEDEYVTYESCTIEYNGKAYNGCRSKNFLLPGEMFLSYEKIYNIMTGKSLTEDITSFGSPEERISFTADVIKRFCGLDVKESISKNLTASMVLLDTDRHLNNIGIIANADYSTFRAAPIFDNGASFLSMYSIYPPNIIIDDIENGNVSIIGKPFSASLEYQTKAAGFGIRFDFDKFSEVLSRMENSRMKTIAEYSVCKYSNIMELCNKQAVPGFGEEGFSLKDTLYAKIFEANNSDGSNNREHGIDEPTI